MGPGAGSRQAVGAASCVRVRGSSHPASPQPALTSFLHVSARKRGTTQGLRNKVLLRDTVCGHYGNIHSSPHCQNEKETGHCLQPPVSKEIQVRPSLRFL